MQFLTKKNSLLFTLFACLSLSLDALDPFEEIFTSIYQRGEWGVDESGKGTSGTGSSIENAGPYMMFLQTFLKAQEIQNVIDAGCGDWSFSRFIHWGKINYLGIDIVQDIIECNQKQYSSPTTRFIYGNILDDLPSGDLLICKDVLQHLSNEAIRSFLSKISKFKHCLITNDVDPLTLTSTNPDISSGSYRYLDLTQPPFCLKGTKVLTYQSDKVMKQVIHVKPDQIKKTVLLSILARNKAHTLPLFLKCIEKLDYDKNLIGIYINTNNNVDQTLEILLDWIKKNQKNYRFICLETQDVPLALPTDPHHWTPLQFSVLGQIRNKSLKKTTEYGLDYYFVVDCDNFITPCTLKELIHQDKPIVAPMLVAIPENNDFYSNFFTAVDENGYYLNHPNYAEILFRKQRGTFLTPVVHCTYLIKSEYLDKLSYIDDSHDFEFIIFSRNARRNGVDQYICNEKDFGFLTHFFHSPTLEEEKDRLKTFFDRISFD